MAMSYKIYPRYSEACYNEVELYMYFYFMTELKDSTCICKILKYDEFCQFS